MAVEILIIILAILNLILGWILFKLNQKFNTIRKYSDALEKESKSLIKLINSRNKDLENLRKTNTLLQAKIDSQEQKIKKISQFFNK